MHRFNDERRLIMIVDDSVTVRKVTSRLLERQGYDVVTAKDGVEAIEQLESIKPDLMLLDIEMPRMDGFEVTNLVRHHDVHRNMPIIMITSRTGEKHRERAFALEQRNIWANLSRKQTCWPILKRYLRLWSNAGEKDESNQCEFNSSKD